MARANTSPFAICWPERYRDLQTQYTITATINPIQHGKKKCGTFSDKMHCTEKSQYFWDVVTWLGSHYHLSVWRTVTNKTRELPHFACKTRVCTKKLRPQVGPVRAPPTGGGTSGRVVERKGGRRTSAGACPKRQLKIYFLFFIFRGNCSVF